MFWWVDIYFTESYADRFLYIAYGKHGCMTQITLRGDGEILFMQLGQLCQSCPQ